jgi:hypothetical protein
MLCPLVGGEPNPVDCEFWPEDNGLDPVDWGFWDAPKGSLGSVWAARPEVNAGAKAAMEARRVRKTRLRDEFFNGRTNCFFLLWGSLPNW